MPFPPGAQEADFDYETLLSKNVRNGDLQNVILGLY